jgi:hypothetical protein
LEGYEIVTLPYSVGLATDGKQLLRQTFGIWSVALWIYQPVSYFAVRTASCNSSQHVQQGISKFLVKHCKAFYEKPESSSLHV